MRNGFGDLSKRSESLKKSKNPSSMIKGVKQEGIWENDVFISWKLKRKWANIVNIV